MKYIRTRRSFLLTEEAKLRDTLYDVQKQRVAEVWGEKFLDYETVEPTDKIKQGKWELSEEDKDAVINRFFDTNYGDVRKKLKNLPQKFVDLVKESFDYDSSLPNLYQHERERVEKVTERGENTNINIREPKVKQLSILYYNIFRLLSVNDTKNDEMVLKGEDGRPIFDDDGKIQKVKKEPGSFVFSNNYTNINSLVDNYNRTFPDEKVDTEIFKGRNIQNIVNMVEDNPKILDFDLFSQDKMYLLIQHDPKFILNMSVSKFYTSCQELYRGGGHGTSYMRQLLSNVFDPNSIPAFLIFDTPYYGENSSGDIEKLSEVLPLTRLMIRNIEPFDSDEDPSGIFFDKTYPDRMEDILTSMIEKYSGNFDTANERGLDDYYFYADVDIDDFKGDDLKYPYMDRLGFKKGVMIGKNTKRLYLSNNIDWSTAKIAKDNNVKEIIIETTDIPNNTFEVPFDIEWIKFKYISINKLDQFKKLLTKAVSFHQCSLSHGVLDDLYELSPDIKKLSFVSTEIKDTKDIEKFEGIEELEIVYSIDDEENLRDLIDFNKFKNLKILTVSGDLYNNQDNKDFLNSLERIEVLTKGLVL